MSGFPEDDNQRAIIKKIILDERAEAREILLEVEGNEGLLAESERRRDIATNNPNVIFTRSR